MQPDMYQACPAAPVISAFVRRYMYADTQARLDTSIRVAPTGFSYISQIFHGQIFCAIDSGQRVDVPGLCIACQVDHRDTMLYYEGSLGNIMAEVYPTAIFRLFGIPLGTLRHFINDGFDLLPVRLARELADRLLAAATQQQRIAAFDAIFIDLIAKARPEVPHVDAAVKIIDQAQGRILITDLCDQLALTERSLSRKFKHIIGLSPKFYARVVQMNAVVAKLHSHDYEQLTELADECGYYDQSHFDKVLQEFFECGVQKYLAADNHMFHLFIGRKLRERAKEVIVT